MVWYVLMFLVCGFAVFGAQLASVGKFDAAVRVAGGAFLIGMVCYILSYPYQIPAVVMIGSSTVPLFVWYLVTRPTEEETTSTPSSDPATP